MDTSDFGPLLDRAHREIDAGLLPACQLAVARNGEIELFETIGDATESTRFVVYSATKAFVAGAMWILIGEGAVDIGKPVAEYIPEFATNGKDVITVEQVMLHTSGFPHAPLGPPAWWTRDGRVEQFASWKLNWEPGSAYEYHPTSAHWVLVEIIDRVTGTDYRDYIEQRVSRPAGLDRRVLGIAEDDQEDIATVVSVGEQAGPEELEAAFGIRELPVGEVTPEALLMFNQPRVRSLGVPGGGGVMRATDLAIYYQALLHNEAGVWKPDVLADATQSVRNNLPDRWTRIPANRALGVIVSGTDGHLRGFGKTQSPRTFGHNGAGGQIAWADPESGISFAYLTNGLDEHVLRQARRGVALSSIAATT
jgi:CubicO group peptidase (beta-lactamase class C family)